MLYFGRVKTALIVGVCILGALLCLPNVLPQPAAWVPWRTVHLGLDLRGGSYLLLQVDMAALGKERLDTVLDRSRQALAGKYRSLAQPAGENRVSVVLRDPAQAQAAIDALKTAAANPDGTQDFDIATRPDGTLSLTLNDAALRARATGAVQQSIEIVRRRIDATGVLDPQITRQGDNRIVVQLPGIDDPNRIKQLLGTTAKMTFHLVDEGADPNRPAPPGDEILPMENDPNRKLVIRRRVEVDGSSLTDASPARSSLSGEWVVNFVFDSTGARRFGEVTTANVNHPFAIVLDDKVLTAPNINEPITGGRGQISGQFTAQSATDLSVLLRAGALPAPLTVVEERTVGPELGADSIRAGAIALGVGFLLVVGFMGTFYGLFGWFANIALVINLLMMLAILSLLEATLTLPGMAGILLTLGMAVDANILINERIREETKLDRKPVAALEAGFRRAYSTIIDSNATAFLAHVMLFVFGSGPVRGFAVTITVGIVTTLFTATVVARLLMVRWYTAPGAPRCCRFRNPPCSTPLFRMVPDGTRIHFMRGRFIGLATSAVLSVFSLVVAFYPGLNLGIDFKGGIIMEVRTPAPADFNKIRAGLSAHQVPAAGLQRFGDDRSVLIRLDRQPTEAGTEQVVARVRSALEESQPGAVIQRTDAVGASVSEELFRNGLLALGISLLMILAYIWFRFEWQFAVGAVVTLLLDVTKVIGFLVVTRIEFDLVMVAAILTVIGYSTNDKVVVYDRVRENLRKYKTMTLRELIDFSINETLNRTLGTSMTVFLASLPLALFGGSSLSGFADVMLFGIVVGTSSSIFIAAPILLLLGENRLRRDAQAPVAPKAKPAR